MIIEMKKTTALEEQNMISFERERIRKEEIANHLRAQRIHDLMANILLFFVFMGVIAICCYAGAVSWHDVEIKQQTALDKCVVGSMFQSQRPDCQALRGRIISEANKEEKDNAKH